MRAVRGPHSLRAHIVGVGMLWTAAMAAAAACEFDCVNQVCGDGSPVLTINYSFYVGYSLGEFDDEGQFVGLAAGDYYFITVVDLRDRGITSVAHDSFRCWDGGFQSAAYNRTSGVLFDGNPLGQLPNASAAGLDGILFFSFEGCNITGLVAEDLAAFTGGNAFGYHDIAAQAVLLNLKHNNVSQLDGDVLSQAPAGLWLDLGFNRVAELPTDIVRNFGGLDLVLRLYNNELQALPTGLCNSSFPLNAFALDASHNNISSVGLLFDPQFDVEKAIYIELNNNLIDSIGLVSIFTSYPASAPCFFDLSHNLVTELQESLFSKVGSPIFTFRLPPAAVLNVSHNPLARISPNVFGNVVTLGNLDVDISHATGGPVDFPERFEVRAEIPLAIAPRSEFVWRAEHTGATLDLATALSTLRHPLQCTTSVDNTNCTGGCGTSCNLTVDLSSNKITAVPSGSMARAKTTKLILSDNGLTYIAADAFNYSFHLKELVLSNNSLSSISISMLDNLPALFDLSIQNNSIIALPFAGNRIPYRASVVGNPLQCEVYGPVARGCSCSSPLIVSRHCGYVRCTESVDGCGEGLFLNSSSCAHAPASVCVNGSAVNGTQFYDVGISAFLPVTQCTTAYPNRRTDDFLEAYEFASYTVSSDRLCSICSVCPSEYTTTPCTPTSDSKCTLKVSVSPLSVAALTTTVICLIVIVVICYRRKVRKTRELRSTKNYLELTEQLLGDEREENERMGQAWRIPVTDLSFGTVLGNGAFGRVFAGKWGHIPVAIKVLKQPLDELDPLMAEDFEREVKFMRSIRHPHVLTLLGAGVNANDQAYLVTELMANGSLRSVLRDTSRKISWHIRLRCAGDIAAGMRYLHDIGTVHRDLKADNCFVDHAMRVKVGDFGTGRIASTLKQRDTYGNELKVIADPSKTMTRGMGTILWMAPEMLSGQRVTVETAPALDVYSFAMVLFEIWGRRVPWEEIKETGVRFSHILTKLVTRGTRPALPDEEAPQGYRSVMEDCWKTDPKERPSFAAIVTRLEEILDRAVPETAV